MQFGFSTYFSMQKPIGQIIDEFAERGVGAIELSYELPHVLSMDESFVAKVGELRKNGIVFSMHGPFFEINLGSYIEEIRRVSKERNKKAIAMAAKIGCDPLVVHPGYSFMTNRVKELEERLRIRFIEDMLEVTAFADQQGVRIALENVHMPYFFFCDLKEFPGLQQLVPGIGMTLDLGHAYLAKRANGAGDPEGEILADIRTIGIEKVFHVHLHNNTGERDDHLFLKGDIDMKRLVHGLKDLGYNGKVIVESFEIEEYGIGPVLERLNAIRA
ncbi:MAG: endonuclease IV [Syntrophorhabdus sp. PtaU1.Bin058]|nr:MAG: endonuclease IV [Syntrophorhabdus sp. PtaU1.Bin058]